VNSSNKPSLLHHTFTAGFIGSSGLFMDISAYKIFIDRPIRVTCTK
jgi:hypothetical protein